MQPPAGAQKSAQLPDFYMRTCLEHVHGSTSRIDDLVAGLMMLLRKACVIGEEVMTQAYGGGLQPGTVLALQEGALLPFHVCVAGLCCAIARMSRIMRKSDGRWQNTGSLQHSVGSINCWRRHLQPRIWPFCKHRLLFDAQTLQCRFSDC